MRRSRIIALVLSAVMMFCVIRPSYAEVSRGINESESLLRLARMVVGGTAGFFVGGGFGAFAGAGLMVVINPLLGCPGCQEIGSPIVY